MMLIMTAFNLYSVKTSTTPAAPQKKKPEAFISGVRQVIMAGFGLFTWFLYYKIKYAMCLDLASTKAAISQVPVPSNAPNESEHLHPKIAI